MKKLLLTLSMLLTISLSFSAVAAHSTSVQNTEPQRIEEVEGLKSAYGRTYRPVPAIGSPAAVPEIDPAEMNAEPDFRMIDIYGFTFESEVAASLFLETQHRFVKNLASDSGEEELAAIAELDGDHDGFYATFFLPNETVISLVVFADGHELLVVEVTAGNQTEAEAMLFELIQFITDSEIKSEQVSFNPDGTSTGGEFDRMPRQGDPILNGLEPVRDMDLLKI